MKPEQAKQVACYIVNTRLTDHGHVLQLGGMSFPTMVGGNLPDLLPVRDRLREEIAALLGPYEGAPETRPADLSLVMVEAGEGCDYTIGCGEKVQRLSATTQQRALEESRALLQHFGVLGDGDGEGERSLSYARIVQHVCDVPVSGWKEELAAKRKEAGVSAASARDRAEYERLKKIFAENT